MTWDSLILPYLLQGKHNEITFFHKRVGDDKVRLIDT